MREKILGVEEATTILQVYNTYAYFEPKILYNIKQQFTAKVNSLFFFKKKKKRTTLRIN